jgi:hypothetical protein
MLTKTNIVSLTRIDASGNANPADPALTPLVDADFDAELALLGYSRSFAWFGRTAVGSILMPVGDLDGEVLDRRDSNRGFGDPVLQLGLNLVGAPAMKNMPDLLRFEPDVTVDLVLDLAVPIGEYDEGSPTNIGQNRWYGRVGVPIMFSLGDWVPGRRTTLELLPAVWLFGDNDDFVGQRMENDPMLQLESHLTRDFTEAFWGSLDAVWYHGAESTIGSLSGDELNDVGVGFTLGYQINDNMLLTMGDTVTTEDGRGDLDLRVFRVNLVFGWHRLLEGIRRLEGGG